MEKSVKFYRIISVAMLIVIAMVLIYANGLRVDNVYKNVKLYQTQCELTGYKNSWNDFNKSFIPSTCLPRVHEIEMIYNEKIKD